MTDLATRYRELVENNLLAVYDSSVDGRLLSCNDAFARLIGCTSSQEALAADLPSLYVDPGARKRFVTAIKRHGRVENARGDFRNLRGEVVHVMLTGIGEFDARRNLIGIHGFLVDISEGIEAQRVLREREREFAERLAQTEKIETVGRLAGGIAHDFNNLLTAILGYAELLLAGDQFSVEQRQDVEEIHKAGKRAASLTQQLLAFSRKQLLRPKDVDLNETVTTLRSMLTRLIREDITLTCEFAHEPAVVRIDPIQIEQALLNLVLNARDALPGGGCIKLDVARVSRSALEAGIDIEAAHANEFVRLRVSDNGIGISPDARPHLFEPFFTTKDVGKGTGLGLASVYGIVKQSDGFIAVESELGQGSAFSLYFPAVVGRCERDRPAQAPPPRPGSQETVLLVEDEQAVRTIVGEMLRRHGYNVLEAASPSVAFALFEQNRSSIDLLLSDVIMPEMNGPALAQRLIGLQPDLRILFMSGYVDTVGQMDRISPHIGFLAKPFHATELVDRVREMLTRDVHASARHVTPAGVVASPL